MKASCSFSRVLFLGAAALLLVRNKVSAKPRSFWDGWSGIVKACDDFVGEGEIVASGTVTFLRPLNCTDPMVFNMYNKTVIRSHDVVNTTNVHFIVHPGGSLAFDAKAVVLARDEDSELPLLKTSGEVLFHVKGWSDAYADGGIEDKGKVVEVLQGGGVHSTHTLHYTPTTLAVANEEARDVQEESIKLSPLLQKMLDDFHAGKRSPSTDSSSTPAGETLPSVGVIAALKASRENAASPELTAEYKVSSRVTHAHGQAISKRKANTDNSAAAAAAAAAATETTADVKPGVSPAPPPSAYPSPASDKSSSSSSSRPRNDHWVKKPDHSLQVGEDLTGFLKSGDGRSVFWPGVDGSFRFGEIVTPPVAGNEFGVGFGVIRATSLAQSDSEKAREALLLREELREEARGGTDGVGNTKKGAKAEGSWWSWRGSSKHRQREIAAQNAGEVCIRVTNEGCVQATVDGTIVLSESGRPKWGWINRRPVDERYQLHVTDTGIEVRLEDRPVWGMAADEWLG